MAQNNDIALSFVIPVYRASKNIVSLLESLRRQQADVPFEVLIVDDASPDDTAKQVQEYIDRERVSSMRLFRLPNNEGPAVARNFAISKAKGDSFLLIDSDCFLFDDRHIQRMWEAHREEPEAVVGGAVDGRGKGYIAFCDHFCNWATNIPKKIAAVARVKHLVTAHLLIPRTVWEKAGPFEPVRTGEDTIFCLKAHRANIPLKLRGDLVLGHHDRESWQDFVRCFYLCGRDREATRRLVYGRSPWYLSGPKILRFLAIPLIAGSLTLSHLKSWWPYDKRVVLALPGVLLGMLSMACGVFAVKIGVAKNG